MWRQRAAECWFRLDVLKRLALGLRVWRRLRALDPACVCGRARRARVIDLNEAVERPPDLGSGGSEPLSDF